MLEMKIECAANVFFLLFFFSIDDISEIASEFIYLSFSFQNNYSEINAEQGTNSRSIVY